MPRGERGFALMMVLITAVVFTVAAFAALTIAVSGAQQMTVISDDHLRARYSAEAGLVWAMQWLWAHPAECFLGSSDFSIDTDGAGSLPLTWVDIAADPCPGPGVSGTLSAKVTYTP